MTDGEMIVLAVGALVIAGALIRCLAGQPVPTQFSSQPPPRQLCTGVMEDWLAREAFDQAAATDTTYRALVSEWRAGGSPSLPIDGEGGFKERGLRGE